MSSMANFLLQLREFESTMCCFPSVTVAAKCLALWGPLVCPFFPGCPLSRAHSCIPKSSVCSKTLTSRGRKGLPETAPLARSAVFVLYPPLEIAEPAWLSTYPGRASPGACPNTGEQPLAGPPGPPAPLIPLPALPGQQARQAGDALTESRWSPAEVSGPQQWKHIDHIAPFIFFSLNFGLEVSPLITRTLPPGPRLTPCPVIAACQRFWGERSASLLLAHSAVSSPAEILLEGGKAKGCPPFPYSLWPFNLVSLVPLSLLPSFPFSRQMRRLWGPSAPAWATEAQHHSLPYWAPLSSSSFCPLTLVYVHVRIK